MRRILGIIANHISALTVRSNYFGAGSSCPDATFLCDNYAACCPSSRPYAVLETPRALLRPTLIISCASPRSAVLGASSGTVNQQSNCLGFLLSWYTLIWSTAVTVSNDACWSTEANNVGWPAGNTSKVISYQDHITGIEEQVCVVARSPAWL